MRQQTTLFKAPWFLLDGHMQTIWPSLFRQITWDAQPERLTFRTEDNDELWADYYPHQEPKALAILCHGLEGHSRRPYILGMARALYGAGMSVLAWNYRSCGGQMNNTAIFYHSGATYDLKAVLSQLPGDKQLPVFLVGFSLGGNLVLRFLGEAQQSVPERVKGAAAISVPLFLADGADQLNRGLSRLYTRNFLKSLRLKIKEKAHHFPGLYRMQQLHKVDSLRAFDEQFTAPIHGFGSADDYYARASAGFVLEQIAKPVLLIQAKNDPFLPQTCFPDPANRLIEKCYPNEGGHVGFMQAGKINSFAEDRVIQFFEKLCITCSNHPVESN